MDYLSLTKKFWTFNDVYPLSAPIVAIYLFLLDNWDKAGGKDFEFSDKVMSKRLKINRKTIKTSKDTLRNLLMDFLLYTELFLTTLLEILL